MAERENELVFLPLGGVGEIGMNFALYGYGPAAKREWMIVDCGVTFPGPELPGTDLVLPDISFVEEHLNQVKGMVITHAHEDHYGALLALWPRLNVPVFATPFTAGLLESKRRGNQSAPKVPLTIFEAGDTFKVGPFTVEAVPVNHSIPEPVSLAICTDAGIVIHTGDWKIDPKPSLGPLTEEARFKALGDEGVLALVCDSTNAMRDGVSPTEEAVSASLAELISQAEGRVAITTFSSNVGRLRSIAEAAEKAGRQVLVMGRSMKRVIDVATELGYMDDLPPFLSEEDFGYIPRANAVIICTGSQGESRAALGKLSRDEMRDVHLSAGDTVIYSSRVIPGNEKAILDVKNNLIEKGVKIIEDHDALVHVSGHPRRDELRTMYSWVKPKIGVPVHGEAAHLVSHANLIEEIEGTIVGKVRNGQILRLTGKSPEVIDNVPSGRIFKDGHIIGDEIDTGVKDRRKLSFAGHVSANVLLDNREELMDDPDVMTMGIPEFDADGESIEDLVSAAIASAIESMPRKKRRDLDIVQDAARRAARATVDRAWGKKPMTTIFVTQV